NGTRGGPHQPPEPVRDPGGARLPTRGGRERPDRNLRSLGPARARHGLANVPRRLSYTALGRHGRRRPRGRHWNVLGALPGRVRDARGTDRQTTLTQPAAPLDSAARQTPALTTQAGAP